MEILKKIPAKRRPVFAALAALAVIVLLFLGFRWLTEWRFLITTDDAYVQGDIAAIAPKLSAYIKEVPVLANQSVKQNDVLFLLDDGDFRIALGEAEAKLATQKRTLERIEKQIAAARSGLEEAKAAYSAAEAVEINAQAAFSRAEQLQKQQYAPASLLDKTQSELSQAKANVTGAQAQVDSARVNIDVLQAQYNETFSQTDSLQLARDQAARDLSFTIIRAPFDGIVGNLAGKKGDLVSNGQRIAALVPKQLYIDANYKETQINDIYGGETAYISVDGYDGGTFKGKVDSLAPATGSVFSILPPQNATGNFTKIVQRVPVRIALPENILAAGRIRAGMSAKVSIDTRSKGKHARPIAAPPQEQAKAQNAAREIEKTKQQSDARAKQDKQEKEKQAAKVENQPAEPDSGAAGQTE